MDYSTVTGVAMQAWSCNLQSFLTERFTDA